MTFVSPFLTSCAQFYSDTPVSITGVLLASGLVVLFSRLVSQRRSPKSTFTASSESRLGHAPGASSGTCFGRAVSTYAPATQNTWQSRMSSPAFRGTATTTQNAYYADQIPACYPQSGFAFTDEKENARGKEQNQTSTVSGDHVSLIKKCL